MTVYYILLVILGIVSFFTIGIKNRNKLVIPIVAILMVLIQGLRHKSIGVDIAGYLNGYNLSKNMNFINGEKLFNYETGYSLFNKMLSSIGISEQLFLAIVSLIITTLIGIVWIKKSKMPGFSVLLYLAFGFFTFTFSGLRQSIALSILFFSFLYIEKRNFIKFILSVLLASTFHKTAIIFIVAYPLYDLKLNLKHYIFIIPSFIICFILKAQIFKIVAFLFKGEEVQAQSTGAYGLFIFMIGVLTLSYIFYNSDSKEVNAYRNYILVAIFIQMLASQSNLIGRAGYYFWIFVTLLVPEVLKSQKNMLTRYLSECVVGSFLVIYYLDKLSTGYLNIVPYKFFWQ